MIQEVPLSDDCCTLGSAKPYFARLDGPCPSDERQRAQLTQLGFCLRWIVIADDVHLLYGAINPVWFQPAENNAGSDLRASEQSRHTAAAGIQARG